MSRPGFTSWVRSHRLLAGATAVALAVAGSVGVVTALGGSSDDGDESGGYQPQVREELLDGLEPNPDCPDAEQSPEPGEGEVLITVVRVADGCLRYSGEVVPAGQVDDRLEERRAEPDVVAADRAVRRRQVGTRRSGRTRQGPPEEQWALAPEDLDGEAVRSLWPADAPDVRVAIVDDGVDDQHPDLTSQIVEQAPWVQLQSRHGTHVAGIVAAADDGAGVVGLTPRAQLMDVQYEVDPDPDEDDEDGQDWAEPSDDLGEYVRWAVDHGADVINMSLGGPQPSDTEYTGLLYAERSGVVLVASAGNCGDEHATNPEWGIIPPPMQGDDHCRRRNQVEYPAGHDIVLSVANHDEDGERVGHSTANASVDIAAPGADILSTCPTDDDDDDRPTCELSGTSMASPYVSATAALLKARHPDATPAAIREAITRSARTEHHQPVGSRTDELGWGLLDPEAAAQYLDEHPGGPQPAESPEAQRTLAAFVDVGGDVPQLMVFDDGILHPVHDVPSETGVSSVDWSADRSQLVGTDPEEVFLWNGPASSLDSEISEPCEGCRAAVVRPSSGNELVAAIGDEGVIAQFDPDTLEPGGTVELQLPEGGDGAVLRGDAGGRLLVAHPGAADAAPDTLSLVDPQTGEQVAEHGPDGNVEVGAVAVDAADGERIAYADGPCGRADTVYVLDGDDLEEISTTGVPISPDLGELQVEDLFFNGNALYATTSTTMSTTGVGNDGPLCPEGGSAGLWRLDDDGEGWRQIDTDPVAAVRPVEGMTREPGTGRLTIFEDSDTSGGATARRGTFDPTGGSGADILNLGSELAGSLWATPTRTEVDLAGGNSPPPVTTTRPSGSDGGGTPAPSTAEGAIARYEQFLYALGEGDIDILCEIAGPAARATEERQGIPCEMGFSMVVNDLLTPEEAAALRTATVDPALVETRSSGEVHIPLEAVVADVTFTEDRLRILLGDSVDLAYQDGDWFIVGQ